jgi:hypothetical protein
MTTKEGRAPIVWRYHQKSLNPCSSNPGLFADMLKRQEEIKNSPEVETNYHRYSLMINRFPPIRWLRRQWRSFRHLSDCG